MSPIHHRIDTDDVNKPWLLVLHGLFGSLSNLSVLTKQLTQDFQVLSADLPDHGKSDFSTNANFVEYAQSINHLLTQLDISCVSIVGHSLGGKVAMQLALLRPEMVTHLVVLDIAPVQYQAQHNQVFNGLNNINLLTLTHRQEADIILSEYVDEASTRQFLLKSLYLKDKKWCWRFNLHQLHSDYSELSKAVRSDNHFLGPTLFIKGELSDYLLVEHKPAILALFPNSQWKMIGGVGHWLHAEKPTLCYKMIKQFIVTD
jgi:esterase